MEGAGDTREYVGGYDDYLRQRKTFGPKKISAKGVTGKGSAKDPAKPKDATKLTYKDQRELDGLPKAIAALEAEIIDMNARLDDPEFFKKNADGFAAAAARLEQAKIDLLTSEERWLALEAMHEALTAGKS
jgi:ATP-binding cassette subfamily F protein uup